jgi:DNA-binding transcriptional LysR family regulator
MLEEVTLASPSYLARYGTPEHPDRLDGHRMVGFHSSATGALAPLEFLVGGQIRNVTLPATLSVNAAESFHAAARLGLGIIQVPRYHAQRYIDSGELVPILQDYPLTRTPVSLLYPRNRQLSPRVRVFIEWLTKVFARQT